MNPCLLLRCISKPMKAFFYYYGVKLVDFKTQIPKYSFVVLCSEDCGHVRLLLACSKRGIKWQNSSDAVLKHSLNTVQPPKVSLKCVWKDKGPPGVCRGVCHLDYGVQLHGSSLLLQLCGTFQTNIYQIASSQVFL